MNCSGLKELLEAFVDKKCEASEYPSELDELISDTARTGVVRFSWQLLKPLLKFRLESVLKSEALVKFSEGDEELANQLTQRLEAFDNPPFTIQRVCELVVHPKQHYKRRDRYLRAMEKNLMVVSTQQPDLTWMKSPRLTQLLEEPTFDRSKNHNHMAIENAELTEQSGSLESALVGDSGTTAAGGGSETEQTQAALGNGLPRKRTASLRDSLDSSGGTEQQEVMGLVLQEADSTTIEHASQPPDGNEPSDLGDPSSTKQLSATPDAKDSQVKENSDVPRHSSPPDNQQPPKLGGLGSSAEGSGDDKGSVEPTVSPEGESCKDTEMCSMEETAAKKIKCIGMTEPPREDGEMVGHQDLTVPGNEGSGMEMGGAEVEAIQKKETYKEAATGQMEMDTQSESDQVAPPEMMETS